jgi:hypothetical protein
MTIRRGEAWGEVVVPPTDLVVAEGDANAAELIREKLDGGLQAHVGLRRGDLARTVGGGADGRFQGEVLRAPADVLRVSCAHGESVAVAHVVARKSWWRGEVVFFMNAQYFGRYDVVPRGHPNDGRFEVLRVSPDMVARARWQAVRRARTGLHLPHPQLVCSSSHELVTSFRRPLTLYIDGRRWVRTSEVRITAVADAFVLYA